MVIVSYNAGGKLGHEDAQAQLLAELDEHQPDWQVFYISEIDHKQFVVPARSVE